VSRAADTRPWLATAAIAVRQCLEQWLGVPYPFPDLQMIETSFDLDQVPGVIFVNSDDLFLPRQAWGQSGTAHRIAREVAHGWFPHVAKVASSEASWLGESLADYTAAHCLSLFGADPKNGARLFNSRVDEWKEASKSAGDDVSVLLAEHLGVSPTVAITTRAQAAASPIDMPESPSVRHMEHASNTVHGLLLQGRGPLVLHGVRERLVARYGEEKGTSMFLVWIRYYVKNFTYKAASTRVLIELLEKITGESWQAYFEQYLFGTDPSPVK
jgi:hypothetical protein